MLIRDFQSADVSDSVRLYDQLGYPTDHQGLTKRLSNLLKQPTYDLLVAVYHQKVIAFCAYGRLSYFERDGDYFRILGLVVEENYRRQGIATRLLGEVQARAIHLGIDTIALNSGLGSHREAAHTFYEKLGFQKASIGFAWMKEEEVSE